MAQPKYVVLVMHHILAALQNVIYHYILGSLVPRLSPHTTEKPKATENQVGPGNKDKYLSGNVKLKAYSLYRLTVRHQYR